MTASSSGRAASSGHGQLAVRESLGLSADGRRVYVRTTEDIVAAISTETEDAEAVWETDAGVGRDINSAQLVEKDGVVFYGTKDGLLLALDAATARSSGSTGSASRSSTR